MDEDEAALLAELKTISNRSAQSRFDTGNNNYDDNDENKNNADGGGTTNYSSSNKGTPPRKDPAGTVVTHPSRQASPIGGGGSRQRTPSPATRRGPSPARRLSPSGNNSNTNKTTTPVKAPAKRTQMMSAVGRSTKPPVDRVEAERRKSELKQQSPSSSPSIKSDADRFGDDDRSGISQAPPSVPLDDDSMPTTAGRQQSPGTSRLAPKIDSSTDSPSSMMQRQPIGIKSDLPNTFKGDRGGTAEDAELLAELRAISAKSGASDRFASEDGADEAKTTTTIAKAQPATPPPPSRTKSTRVSQGTPPWKRKSAATVSTKKDTTKAQDDVVVVAPPAPETNKSEKYPVEQKPAPVGGIKSNLPNTFKGDRGGPAEDEELLAELRAISNKATNDRFQSNDDDEREPPTESQTAVIADKSAPRPQAKSNSNNVPPWKRNGLTRTSVTSRESVRAASPASRGSLRAASPGKSASQPQPPASPLRDKPNHGGIQSDLPNTFHGDRGGAAEDAELLAELRAISSKSGASTRFSGEDDEEPPPKEEPSVDRRPVRNSQSVKSYGRSSSNENVASRAEDKQPAPPRSIKSSLPKTFNGDRGGTAEDEELLAELRAISAKSGASNRFASEGDDGVADSQTTPQSRPTTTSARPNRDSTPPWKRKSSTSSKPSGAQSEPSSSVVSENTKVSAQSAAENTGFGIRSSLPNTFKGERGGPAEDAELLAELRAISAGSGAARFSADNEQEPPKRAPERQQPSIKSEPPPARPPPASVPSQSSVLQSDEEVTEDNLPDALASKDWKIRVQAYDLLNRKLQSLASNQDSAGSIDGNLVMENLDNMAAKLAEDTNVGALDKALEFLLTYADCCERASASEQAAAITISLVRKNGLSSRPTTSKLASDLALKLMEVGANGASSAHAVIEVLIKEGLKSKKPKVVQASGALIHSACVEFGVSVLPLHSVESAIPQMLSNPNAKLREIGLQILAELCRALSKTSFQSILDQMKSAQVSELDELLANQPEATVPQRRLRSASRKRGSGDQAGDSGGAAVQTSTAELQAQRYASRPAVNLMVAISKTDYAERIGNQKWSEKVAALKALIEAGGEKPYKLVQPSSSVNYIPLISEMKQLLKHTHFAVVSKAMEVLAMLAEGVGEKLFPQLRPVLPTLLKLTKDKKLTNAVSSAVDAFFGNVLAFDHILDQDDAVLSAVDEKIEKNALARTSSLDFVVRCINRNGNAGPRSSLSSQSVSAILSLAVEKLDDSDAGVRKEAMNVFHALKALDNPEYLEIVDQRLEAVKTSHTRAYKMIAGESAGSTPTKAASPSGSTRSSPSSTRVPAASGRRGTGADRASITASPARKSAPSNRLGQSGLSSSRSSKPPPKTATNKISSVGSSAPKPASDRGNGNKLPPRALEDARNHLSQLDVPAWDAAEDDGGVLAGLSASKWTLKNDAIRTLSGFVETGQVDIASKDTATNSASILCVTKEHTRGFKETNVNIMKSILQLFCEICAYHQSSNVPLMDWAMVDGVAAALHKIQDKKLFDSCAEVLSSLCLVCFPNDVVVKAVADIESIKSPVAHENMLKWMESFFKEFGVKSVGHAMSDIIPWLLGEVGSSNPKVKKEACFVVAELHKQLGPSFKALVLQLSCGSNQDVLEQAFESSPYDPNEATMDRPKQSICGKESSAAEGEAGEDFVLDIPKSDLGALLDDDIVSKLNAKDGKTAWKMRKEAIEEVTSALKSCNGLLDSSGPKMKFIVDLSRALRDRLGDTQINLRPLAARTIGDLFSKVDRSSQVRLGKIFFPALVNSSMHDIKKPVRDAAIEGINCGAKMSPLEGSEPNKESLEVLFVAFTSEFNDTALRSTGVADLLTCLYAFVETLPNFTEISAAQGTTLADRFAKVLIECLSSSKSEVRSAAFSLIERSIEFDVITASTCQQAVDTMKPAKQRSVAPMIAKLEKPANPRFGEKENVPAAETIAPPAKPTAAAANESLTAVKSSISGRGSLIGRRGSLGRQEQNSLGPAVRRGSVGRQEPKPSSKQQMTRSMPLPPSNLPPSNHRAQEPSQHPLLLRTSKVTQPKPVAWPPFPEEPNHPLYINLKRSWAPSLPGPSAVKLFPPGGIKKQDDAQEGCELLEYAIDLDSESGTSDVIEGHLECLLKWISFVLCCKEATVGLNSLISLIRKLFDFLLQNNRGLSEDEVGVLVPFLIEKTSNAKGRFRDSFMEIINQLQNETLVSPKILGPVACVQVIERSNHAKARALGFTLCRDCVLSAGLPGIGKKGVVAAAKSLSEEQLPETKAAGLDLMEEILRKMNGDINKLAKICGSALSGKAHEAIEERWKKSGSKKEFVPPTNSSTSTTKPMESVVDKTPERKITRSTVQETPGSERSAHLHDELPAFNLRSLPPGGQLRDRQADDGPKLLSTDPFVFAHAARSFQDEAPLRTEHEYTYFDQSRSLALQDPVEAARAQPHDIPDNESIRSMNTSQTSGTLGTAASLRARLLRIKEKNRAPDADKQKSNPEKDLDDISAVSAQGDGREEYKLVHGHVKALLCRSVPLQEDDAGITTTTRSLKKVHTALANTTENNGEASTPLKNVLIENLSSLISQLIRIIRFSLDCLEPSKTAGISIPLLSVSLATLMALFRFADVTSKVGVGDLTALIRETATILLDSRFSSESNLDDATCAQMAKAINKTAVNAATGAPRHISFQALLVVQQQLADEISDGCTDDAKEFNGRLSRVISRLFMRVIKSEESAEDPYSQISMDMGSLVCAMENTLDSCTHTDADACKEMVSNLAESILKVHGGFDQLKKIMQDAAISTSNSSLAKLLNSLAPEEVVVEDIFIEEVAAVPMEPPDTVKRPSVAELVTALGNSKEGVERDAALAALRRHREVFGTSELDAYLEDVSPAFRKFIEDQLATGTSSPTNSESSNSMSERLRKLRTRLQATEQAVKVDETQSGHAEPRSSRPKPLSISSMSASNTYGASRSSRLAHPSPRSSLAGRRASAHSGLALPSPSKVTRDPSPMKAGKAASSESLRSAPQHIDGPSERHVARSSSGSSTTDRTTAAANLRARLEAVKHGKK